MWRSHYWETGLGSHGWNARCTRTGMVTPAAGTRSSDPAPEPLLRLAPWPAVRGHLRRRGCGLTPRHGETVEVLENRIGTSLMALFRDERSDDAFEALYAFARPAVLHWIIFKIIVRLGHFGNAMSNV